MIIMSKRPSNFQKIYAQISKNVRNKRWTCIASNCKDEAINSHLLQQNGVLNTIAEDGYLVEMKPVDSFKWTEKQLPIQFKKISIKQALSLSLFCNSHDTTIFKPIEEQPIDLESNFAHSLFSYRATCAERRKKEITADIYNRLINSKTLTSMDMDIDTIKLGLSGTNEGIIILDFYIQEFEKAIKNKDYSNFVFTTYKYPLIKVYASAAFSPYNSIYTPFTTPILNYVFIHVIPYNKELYIIIGYHKAHIEQYIKDYIGSWENLPPNKLGQKLTHLFATHIESWGMSPSIFNNIKKNTLDKYINYFCQNSNNLLCNQKIDFNLFEDDNFGV